MKFFRKDLKPSIKVQMEQQSQKLDSWTEIIEKTVDAMAKTSLQPALFIQEIDQ